MIDFKEIKRSDFAGKELLFEDCTPHDSAKKFWNVRCFDVHLGKISFQPLLGSKYAFVAEYDSNASINSESIVIDADSLREIADFLDKVNGNYYEN